MASRLDFARQGLPRRAGSRMTQGEVFHRVRDISNRHELGIGLPGVAQLIRRCLAAKALEQIVAHGMCGDAEVVKVVGLMHCVRLMHRAVALALQLPVEGLDSIEFGGESH